MGEQRREPGYGGRAWPDSTVAALASHGAWVQRVGQGDLRGSWRPLAAGPSVAVVAPLPRWGCWGALGWARMGDKPLQTALPSQLGL